MSHVQYTKTSSNFICMTKKMVFFVQQSPPVDWLTNSQYIYYDLPMRVFFFLSFSFCLRLCLLLLTCFSSSVKSRRNIKIKTTMNHLLCHRYFKPRSCALISFFLQGQLMTRHFFFKKIRVQDRQYFMF